MTTRYKQIYNIWNVCAGPAPSTGYHFADYNSNKSNNTQLGPLDTNLVQQIDRINSLQYSLEISRENLTQLGARGLIDRHIINRPEIQLNFNYWIAGVRNEDRLGFVVNYNDITGLPILSQDICCLKNFTGKQTDNRNLFVAVSPDTLDLNGRIGNQSITGDIDPRNLLVWSFGNCYINAYSVRGAVGEIPQASVSYVCENIMISSGSGANIPALHPKSGITIENTKFVIPRSESYIYPSVITPKDITVEITKDNFVTPEAKYDYIYLYNLSTNLYNKIEISGSTNNENIFISAGISSPPNNQFSGLYLKNLYDNRYNRLLTSGNNGNERLIIYSGMTGITGDNVISFLNLKNITTNKYARISPSGAVDIENLIINNNQLLQNSGLLYNNINAYLGINASGINTPLQSFDFRINLNRDKLQSIGYVLPIDRPINFPIFADINTSLIVDDNITGHLLEYVNKNENYNIIINMYNPNCNNRQSIAAQYKIKAAKVENINYSYNLNNKLIANFGFLAEIDIDRPDKGLFISGLLNLPEERFPYAYLLLENNRTGMVLTEDGIPLIIGNV